MYFLSQAFSFVVIYLWAKHNPATRVSFLGIFVFEAVYLPWFYLGLSALLEPSFPWVDILGIVVGHVAYYLDEVYPRVTGRRLLAAPAIL